MEDSQAEQGRSKHGYFAEGNTVGNLIYVWCFIAGWRHVSVCCLKKKKKNHLLNIKLQEKKGAYSTLTLVVNQIFIDIFLNDFVMD